MGESKKKSFSTEEVIAAFDRERDEAREHSRRHQERLRNLNKTDRPVNDRKRSS